MTIKSIRKYIIIIVSMIITLFFVSLGFYNYTVSKKMIHNEIVYMSIPLLRENIYSEIRKKFSPAIGVASVMSKDTFLIHWVLENENENDSYKIIQYLNKIKNEFDYFTTFFISENNGRYYHNSGLHKIISKMDTHDKWYYDFIDSEKEFDLDVDFNEAENQQLTIFINYRVVDFDGNLLGVTGVGLKMKEFSIFLKEQKKTYDRNIYLIDPEGVIQAHSNMSIIQNRTSNDIENILKKLTSDKTKPQMTEYMSGNQKIMVSSKYIEDLDWFLIVEQNESEALKTANWNFIRTLIVGLILLIFILLLVGAVLNFFSNKLEILAITDPLTSCYNRREFNHWLERSLDKKSRTGSQLSLIMIDVDLFKRINDKFGHQFGDYVLKYISKMILTIIRPDDIFCRLGGDEFVILLEEKEEEAIFLANRIKQDLANSNITDKNKNSVKVTLSMGIYESKIEDSFQDIINLGDQALYRAKKSGRNNIKKSVN